MKISMKKLACTSTAVLGLCVNSAMAVSISSDGKDLGNLDVLIKGMSILYAEDNGYDPNNGTSYLLKLKYESQAWNNLKAGAGFYANGDVFGITDFETERVARGMFVTDDGSTKSQLGELYLKYNAEKFAVHGGNQRYATPLTTIAYSNMPNFYRAYGASTTAIDGLKLGAAQITEMSFGARAMTDFGLIGEATKTAGAAINSSLIGQAEFHEISTATFGSGAAETNGITVANATYTGLENTTIGLWDYYVDDIANNVYLHADTMIPLEGMKLKLSGQYLNQQETGDQLGGTLDFDLFGLKAALGSKKWSVYAAVNSSGGDTAMLNAWGGDPAYTSSIFSRNEYRKNVDAYKIGASYKIMKNLIIKVSYANYGKSDTSAPRKVLGLSGPGMVAPQTDAYEADIVLVYKPKKNVMLKTFLANRGSEYDGIEGKDLTQNHFRVIASYKY
ncbi:OprD family outer membrane porin [Candidatus Thiodiazotropha endoloripes]|nr:OprD family outer membrane porin [Candidatus Thiodiazotropha endoloripes]MCG7983133.1 OprD family outer membrane porin [Candidatus Thiodiazotropha lotti]